MPVFHSTDDVSNDVLDNVTSGELLQVDVTRVCEWSFRTPKSESLIWFAITFPRGMTMVLSDSSRCCMFAW